jgi:mannose-6-phosphate isomerase-like protein (cupin superfamily)
MGEIRKLSALQRFSPEKMQKVGLFETPRLFCDLYCLEAGQAQKAHSHGDADKVYLVLEGRAQVQVGADRLDLGPQEAVIAPAGADHGVSNPGPGRLLLYVFVAQSPAAAPSSGGSSHEHGHDHGHGHGHRH